MIKSTTAKHFLATIILIFLLPAFLLTVVFSSFYNISATDIKELGISNMKSQAAMVENYLNRGTNVLWFAAESVEHMMKQDSDDILAYLKDATSRMQEQFDPNFTGLYGYINGEYLDGSGWVPPEDYAPTERSWYREAIAADGEMIVSDPYVDAQTGKIVISFTQLLSDRKSVISLDVILNEVQKITESMTMGDKGYGFIVDSSGLVVAHYDRDEMIDEDKEYIMCQKESEDRNILVVDDELMNIKMVGRIFREIPTVHIMSAMNSDETMSELANNDIDMILLDLKMPDIDGFELYGLIREKYNTPVVIMTADKSSETLEKINKLGIDDYLTKPLNKFVTQEMAYGIINYQQNDI